MVTDFIREISLTSVWSGLKLYEKKNALKKKYNGRQIPPRTEAVCTKRALCSCLIIGNCCAANTFQGCRNILWSRFLYFFSFLFLFWYYSLDEVFCINKKRIIPVSHKIQNTRYQ